MTNFGERLRALRLERGKSQIDIADAIKARHPAMRISQTSLSALERRATAPRGEVLEILAEYFGVPVSELLPADGVATGIRQTVYAIADLIVILVEVRGASTGARRGRDALRESIHAQLEFLITQLATDDYDDYNWVMEYIERQNGKAGNND